MLLYESWPDGPDGLNESKGPMNRITLSHSSDALQTGGKLSTWFLPGGTRRAVSGISALPSCIEKTKIQENLSYPRDLALPSRFSKFLKNLQILCYLYIDFHLANNL